MLATTKTNRIALNAYISIDNDRTLVREELLAQILIELDRNGWNVLGTDDYVNPIPQAASFYNGLGFHCHKTVRITMESIIVRGVPYTVAVPRVSYLWRSESNLESPALLRLLADILEPRDTFRLGTLCETSRGICGYRTPSIRITNGQLNNQLKDPRRFCCRLDSRLVDRLNLVNPVDSVEAEIQKEPALRAALMLGKPMKLLEQRIDGSFLQFARGIGREGSEVSKLGVYAKPTRVVGAILCADKDEHSSTLKWIMSLFTHDRVWAGSETGNGIDSILNIWTHERKFGLPKFILAEKFVKLAESRISSPEYLKATVQRMKKDGVAPICVCFLPSECPDDDFTNLMKSIGTCGCKAIPVTGLVPAIDNTSENGVYRIFVNLALQMAQKAGAMPWVLKDVPGTDPETFFLGVDLGHDHLNKRSKCVLSLVACHGEVVSTKPFDQPLREDLSIDTFSKCSEWLARTIPNGARHLIVHRDGNVSESESELWRELATELAINISLVEIKKDSALRFFSESLAPGTWVELTPCSALMVTSTQAQKIGGQGPPRPIEVKMVAPSSLSLRDAVAQVFALCSMHGSTVRHRLPVTTEHSNNFASTGKVTMRNTLGRWGRS